MTALRYQLMQYHINLVNITLLADTPFPLHQSNKMGEFITTDYENKGSTTPPDLQIVFHSVEKLPEIADVRYQESRRIYVGEGYSAATFFSGHPEASPYAYVSRITVPAGYLCCQYISGNERYMDYDHNLITLMDIEATLLDFNALILHASLIRWKGQGIIFSAPSGTGKSTQADLWAQHQGAEILNGDRAALRQINGIWTAFGLPYAGTSGIYRNESAPLKAIVVLQQAKANRIRRLHGAEAFRYLYPETVIHRWDPFFEKRASDLLLAIIADTPVFLLECRPDEEAVKLLRDALSPVQSL